MPTKPNPQIKAWSYSRLTEWEKCAFKAKLKHIDGLKEPSNETLERGTKIHALAEKFSTGALKKLPEELECFAEEFSELVKIKSRLATEQQIAFNDKWEECDWFGQQAWVRVVIDCYHLDEDRATVIDYKTGKVREENLPQLELYALAIMLRYPEINEVDCEFWYLDQGEVHSISRERTELTTIQKKWSKRALPMLKDKQFKPTVGRHCSYCHFTKTKGGPCAF